MFCVPSVFLQIAHDTIDAATTCSRSVCVSKQVQLSKVKSRLRIYDKSHAQAKPTRQTVLKRESPLTTVECYGKASAGGLQSMQSAMRGKQ
jgi:hypothetical protein